jgi:hypothetical protein
MTNSVSVADSPPWPDPGSVAGVLRGGWRLLSGAFPAIAVATLIPLGLFYVTMLAVSTTWAIVISVVYAYVLAGWQFARRSQVSGMLLMTVFMVTLRAVAAVASGQVVVYFAVPVAETAGFGLLFLATMWSSEPLIIRLVRDLVPHAADELASRPGVVRGLSLIWMVTYLASGATTLALLTTVPIPIYLGAHQLAGWLWVAAGLAVSITLCHRRGDGLLHTCLRPAPATLPAAA